MRNLFVDNFAGGGGASTGIEMAIGRSVDIAINHDPDAIAMHKANHPASKHYCEDVWQVDPVEACGGNPVALAWFSPDCKHFSRAKGGKPVDKNIRGLAWVAVKWAKAVRPAVIMLENVPEIQTWGPLGVDGKPIKERAGETFRSFVRQLEKLGYTVDYRVLKSCDYGAPTSRTRFYLIARSDGRAINWPEPSHGPKGCREVKAGLWKPYRTAAECIDWDIPTTSIFEREKPLCEATLKRIARGLQKFVVDDPEPFIMQAYGGGYKGSGKSLNDPLPTITAIGHNFLIEPYLVQYHSYEDDARGQKLQDPLMTVDTSNRYAVIAPYMVHLYGNSTGQSVSEPMGTVTAKGQHLAQVQAFLVKYYGQGTGQKLTEPLDTVTSKDRFGLVTVQGVDYVITDIRMRMLQPKELFAAMGFPDDYVIDHDAEGRPYPKSKQVARCGNAVTPPVPAALVRANLPEYCKQEVSA